MEKELSANLNKVFISPTALEKSRTISITDDRGVITYVNDNFCKISKYDPEELIGLHHKDLISDFHPSDFWEDIWTTISSGHIWRGEIKHRTKDGKHYWVDSMILPILENDSSRTHYMSIYMETKAQRDARNKQFRTMFDESLDGMLLGRPDGTFIEVNAAFCDMLGYTREEFLSLTRQQITLPEDQDVIEGLRIRMETGQFRGRMKYKRKDGSIIDAEISTAIYQNDEGMDCTYVCVRDITERLRAEQALQGSERRLRALLDQGLDIITLLTADGMVIYRSPSYATQLGYDIGTIGKYLEMELIHPEDKPKIRESFVQLLKAPGSALRSIWRQKHALGHWRWMEGTATNLLHDPAVGALVLNYRDVTDHIVIETKLEEQNQELNYLFNIIDEVLYIGTLDPYRMTHMSAACMEVYGYEPSDFLADVNLLTSIILPEDKHVADTMGEALFRGETATGEYRITHRDGSIRWIEATVMPTLDEEGKFTRFDGINRDITERKKTKEELINSELKFRSLIENSKDGIALSDADRRFTYLSLALKDILGYEPEELMGTLTYELFHPDEREENDRFFALLLNPDTPSASKPMRVKHKNGSWRWIELTATNRLSDPAVAAIISNFHDVTERRSAQEALINSEKKFRAMIEKGKDGIVVTDADRKITYASPSVSTIMGYEPHEVMGSRSFFLKDLSDTKANRKKVANLLAGKEQSISLSVQARHRDGTLRWLEVESTNLIADPAIGAIVSNFRDVTEKKNAEEALFNSERKFRSLIENSKDGITLTDRDRNMIYNSPAIENILGYTSEELLNRNVFEFWHPDDLKCNHKKNMESLTQPGCTVSNVLRLKHKDGSWRWIQSTVTNHLHDPAIGAIVGNIQDITKRKEAEEALEQLNQNLEMKVEERTRQLEESNKALESFSYIAAHDLQSPVKIMAGYASLLRDEFGAQFDEECKQLLNVIIDRAKDMTQLVSDLLEFSRVSHVLLNMQTADLDTMVQDVADILMLGGYNPATAITIQPLGHVSCDAALVKQVWTNLISNALKYSRKKDKPLIEIGSEDRQGETVYYVRDNGAGFDMTKAHNLFTVFKRLHSSSDFEGTGVGLAIVSNVINRHGGRIWAEAEVGNGATFYFTLPG